MSASFHEQFEEQVERPSDRSTGLIFAAASAVIAAVYFRHPWLLVSGLSLAVIFALISLLAPFLLRPLNIAWFALGRLLHKVMGPLIMAVLFFVVVAPFGYLMRLLYDPLRAKVAPDAGSYWIERAPAADGPDRSMAHQF